MEPQGSALLDKKRWHALDIFRGFAVLKLIIFNGFYGFTNAPDWLKHAEWDGYKFPDSGAPFFLFAAGMAIAFSIKKRTENNSVFPAMRHILTRGLILIAFGTIGDMMCFRDFRIHWGTFEMIGGCLLLCGPTIIMASVRQRIAIGFAMMISWILIGPNFVPQDPQLPRLGMGGPSAVISWGSIMIIGSAIGELFSGETDRLSAKKVTALVGLAAGLFFIGFFILGIYPNKTLVNPAYTSLSVMLSCASILIADKFQNSDMLQSIFVPFGKNALILYMISEIINQLMQTAFPTDIPLASLTPYSVLLILISSGTAVYLHKKNKIFTL